MPIVVVDLGVLIVGVLTKLAWLLEEKFGDHTHVVYLLDVNVLGLLRRIRRRLVGWEGFREFDFTLLCLLGNLLSGSLPLLTRLGIVVVLTVGREGRGSGGVNPGTRRPIAGRPGVRSTRVGVSVLVVVNGVVRLGLVISLSLFGYGAGACCTVGGDAIDTGVGNDPNTIAGCFALLGLGCVVNDDYFLGQAILIELVPVGAPRSSTLATGGLGGLSMRGRHSSDRVVRVRTRNSVVDDPRSSRGG